MTDTQTNEAENFDNIPETDTSAEDRFFGLKSVSETHLRAHETVLDFVCRLLL